MNGGAFEVNKKGFIYILFFMVGFMISIVIVDSMKIGMEYAWIPFVSSIVVTTISPCFDCLKLNFLLFLFAVNWKVK